MSARTRSRSRWRDPRMSRTAVGAGVRWLRRAAAPGPFRPRHGQHVTAIEATAPHHVETVRRLFRRSSPPLSSTPSAAKPRGPRGDGRRSCELLRSAWPTRCPPRFETACDSGGGEHGRAVAAAGVGEALEGQQRQHQPAGADQHLQRSRLVRRSRRLGATALLDRRGLGRRRIRPPSAIGPTAPLSLARHRTRRLGPRLRFA